MGTPGKSAHGVFVALQDGERTASWIADIKGSEDSIDAAGCDNGVAILVPVMRQDLGRSSRAADAVVGRGCVDGDGGGEMVFCR